MMPPPTTEHSHPSNNNSFVIHASDAHAATYNGTGPLSGVTAQPAHRMNGQHHQRSASNSSHNAGVVAAPTGGSATNAGVLDEMHRTFPHVPAGERAIRDFQCSMVKKKFMWVGRVYLTPKRVCFIGLISNNVTLEWSQIAKIERKTSVMLEQVVLTPTPDVTGGEVTFGGFTHGIDEPYQMMQTLWGVATRYGGSASGNGSSSTTAKPAPATVPMDASTMSASAIQLASAASPTNASPRSVVVQGKSLAEAAGSSSADVYSPGAGASMTAVTPPRNPEATAAVRPAPPQVEQASKAGSSSSGVAESPSSSIAPPAVSVSAEGDLAQSAGGAPGNRKAASSMASEEVRSPVSPSEARDARVEAARRQHARGRSDSSWSAIPNFFAGLTGNKESGLSTPRQGGTTKPAAEVKPAATSPATTPSVTPSAVPAAVPSSVPVRVATPEATATAAPEPPAQSPPPKVPPILRKPSTMQRQPASFGSAPDSNSSGGPLASTQSFGEPGASGGPPPDPETLAAARAANGAVSPRVSTSSVSNSSLAHNETVLDSFQCSYVLGVHRLGRMTLTQMNVRFTSVMCNPVCVPYTDIDRVEKSTSLMILDSLLLVLRDGTRHEFTSFTGSRDRVYGMVCDLVRSHAQVNAALGIGPTPTQNALVAGKEDTPPLTASGAPAVTPRVALDAPLVAAAPPAAAPPAAAPTDAAAAAAANLPRDQRPENLPASLAKMRAARFVTSLIAPPESAWPVLPSMDDYDTLLGTDLPTGAGGFNNWEKLKKETIIDKMPLPPGYTLTDLFRFILDDDARFALDYRVSRQDTDSTFEPWRPCKKPDGTIMPSSGQRITRCRTIIRALTATVCPYTEFNRVLACQLDGQPHIITHYSGQAVGVMFSDTFRVETMILYRYQTPPGAADGTPPRVVATVQFYINFLKSTIVKGRIRANATPETTEGYKNYIELASKTLKALCPLDGPPVIGPQGEIIPRAKFAVGTVAEHPMLSYSAAPAAATTAGETPAAADGNAAAAAVTGAPTSPLAAAGMAAPTTTAPTTTRPAASSSSGDESIVTTVVSTLLDLPPGPTIRRLALGLCAFYCLRAFWALLFSPHFESVAAAGAAVADLNLYNASPAFVGLATGVRHLVTALAFFLAAKCAQMW